MSVSSGSLFRVTVEDNLDRQSVVGIPAEGSYSALLDGKTMFLAVFGRWSKSWFFTVTAENHLDRQSVVGFPPEGSYSAPFGWKPMFSALFNVGALFVQGPGLVLPLTGSTTRHQRVKLNKNPCYCCQAKA